MGHTDAAHLLVQSNETHVTSRLLATTDAQKMLEFENSSKIAQILSGCAFTGIVLYLIFSNSTRLSFIQRASQEKRLQVCCSLSTMVAAISAFLNFFQITEVDDKMLPSKTNYNVDLCRPIEWILTCPLMQLCLVLMGGARIPEYRRVLMPAFSAIIISFGSMTLFLDEPWPYVFYALGIVTFHIMVFFNRLQIIEHSEGLEGLFIGDSEFRKATIILLLTWVPFPVWYGLSPEGLDVIDNILIIQMGWMILNIISKGALILYIQRCKDNYCARLKMSKLMKNQMNEKTGLAYAANSDEDDEENYTNASLRPCVNETMTFLGMLDKSERFLNLLKEAKIRNLEQVQALTQEDCEEKRLPYDLISAVQQRHRIWTLECQDNAEMGIEKGEKHYRKKSPRTEPPPTNKGVTPDNASPFTVLPTTFDSPMPDMQPNFIGGSDDQDMSGFATMGNSGVSRGYDNMGNLGVSRGYENMGNSGVSAVYAMSEEMLSRLAKLEEKLDTGFLSTRRDFDYAFQSVRRDVEKHAGTSQNAVENSAKGLQNAVENSAKGLGRSIERCQALLDEKIEAAFSTADQKQQIMQCDLQDGLERVAQKFLEQSSVMMQNSADGMSQISQENEANLERVSQKFVEQGQGIGQANEATLARMAQRFIEQTQEVASGCEATMTTVSHSVEDALARIYDVATSSKSVLEQDVDRLISSWAQQIMTESKSNAFTIQAKLTSVEESAMKNRMDLEARLTSNVDYCVQSVRDTCIDKIQQGFSAELQRMEDVTTQSLLRSGKEANESVERHVQVGVGLLTNTLRAQVESLQDLYKMTEIKLSSHMDNMAKQSDKVFQHMNDQKQLSNSCLEQAAAAQVRAKECCDMMADLSDRLSNSGARPRAVPSKQRLDDRDRKDSQTTSTDAPPFARQESPAISVSASQGPTPRRNFGGTYGAAGL